MTSLHESMVSELKSGVVPGLRAWGFKGSFPHFRRVRAGGIDLLTFQFDRTGGGFVIEVSRCAVEGLTTHWGKLIGPSHVTAWDIHPEKRHRIKAAPGSGTDSWFRYDSGQFKDCARQVLQLMPQAEEWWARHA